MSTIGKVVLGVFGLTALLSSVPSVEAAHGGGRAISASHQGPPINGGPVARSYDHHRGGERGGHFEAFGPGYGFGGAEFEPGVGFGPAPSLATLPAGPLAVGKPRYFAHRGDLRGRHHLGAYDGRNRTLGGGYGTGYFAATGAPTADYFTNVGVCARDASTERHRRTAVSTTWRRDHCR